MTLHRPARTALTTAAAIVGSLALTATATATSGGSSSDALSALPDAPVPAAGRDAAVGVSVRTTMTDLDDTQGRLDVRAVHHRVVQVGKHAVRVTYRIQTHGRFRDGLLSSPDREIVLELHRTAPRGADRNITISSVAGELTATVISNATRKPIATVRALRVGPRTVAVTGWRSLIGARSYFVTANFHQGGSRDCGWRDGWPITCQDSVPDAGWLRVDRMGWPDLP